MSYKWTSWTIDSTEMCLDELRRTQSWSSLGCYSSSLIYCSFLSYELWSEEKKVGGKKSQAKVRETDADGEEENNNKQVKEAKEQDKVYNHLLKGSEGKLSIKAEDCDDKAAPRDTILQPWQKKGKVFPQVTSTSWNNFPDEWLGLSLIICWQPRGILMKYLKV